MLLRLLETSDKINAPNFDFCFWITEYVEYGVK